MLEALGAAAVSVRCKLGEPLSSVQKYDAPLEATTPSLEALKAYSLGLKTWHAKGDAAALPFLQAGGRTRSELRDAYVAMSDAYGSGETVGGQKIPVKLTSCVKR